MSVGIPVVVGGAPGVPVVISGIAPGTPITIQVTSTVAFVVEDANALVTFTVDTTTPQVIINNGPLVFQTSISQVVPGATSLSFRNNANNADNLIITDAGAITTRGRVSVGANGLRVTGGVSGGGSNELQFNDTTSGNSAAITTNAVGAPGMNFQHRGTANTGNWLWQNGTNAGTVMMRLDATGLLNVGKTGVLLGTLAALTDGAGVALGTLATAPSAGNPTKWIQINDNGTIRAIPAW